MSAEPQNAPLETVRCDGCQCLLGREDSIPDLSPSDLFASGFGLDALRKRINLSVAKAKFKALPKAERENRAKQAIKTINRLIK